MRKFNVESALKSQMTNIGFSEGLNVQGLTSKIHLKLNFKP